MQGYTLRQQTQFLVTNLIASGIRFEEARHQFNKEFVELMIQSCNGNQSKAARKMGMHRNTLSRWIVTLNISTIELRKMRHAFSEQKRKLSAANYYYERRRPPERAMAVSA